MRPFSSRAAQPTPAERTRSILAAARSMTVLTDGVSTEVHHLDGTGVMGHIHLHEPSGTAAPASAVRLPIRLELTDIAPTPVRDRLRARVTLTGLLASPYDAESSRSTCMEFGQAVLEDATGRTFLSLGDLQAATLDPLAEFEAGMLTHLLDSHGELVPLLLRLVRPQPRRGLLRAVPVALDRYGVTLRLEYRDGYEDVRLLFATAVTDVEHAGSRIHALLTAARRASHPNHLPA
ncbi:DUF2470 domain-containing protein [Streptomyces sp. NBC_01754]|uniref:DUF2470 domain-containing protein n=1 Tax=Streptomyces sp. NBC_01754 TaxID=2975930 RepID=UPI002DDA9927|nr:DUF2470 domain-containing protein [Streptomyces sp. NBC_01754]WSC91618.1 DUF2470 domain-containing protein [Streptomyces sp. NBC_01754]